MAILSVDLAYKSYADIGVVILEQGRGFLERSTMLTQKQWEHERTIDPRESGCVLTDRIRYEPRIPLPGFVLRPLFAAVFRYRHRQLRRRYGGRPIR